MPVILYRQFQDAYSENQRLIERSIQEQGRLITRAIDPLLLRSDQGSPPTPSELREALHQIAGDDITVRLLFSPQLGSGTESFYFVVATPTMSNQLLAETRQELIAQGVFDRLAPTCEGSVDEPIRYRTAAGTEELITSIDARMTAAGCWILITSNAANEFTESPLGVPYWMRPEAHSAAAIYAGMALITLSLFIGIWRNLRRFGRVAQRIGESRDLTTSFADQNRVPELAGVAAEFDRMVETLQHSARAIKRAAEDNTHAFKTPIAVIRHSLEPLGQAVPNIDGRAHSALDRIHKALDRLDELVSYARRMDETEAHLINPPRQRVDVSKILDDILTSYSDLVNQHRINLQVSLEARVCVQASTDLLETVLENLIENAISFTPEGGVIGVLLQQKSPEQVQLIIEDTGPGVAETELEKIFNRYYSRRDKADDQMPLSTGHQGIGLWIVRSNIQAVGGAVRAERGAAGGLRVVTVLPAAPSR